jgi:uncharacterized iron-regulated membrane protein
MKLRSVLFWMHLVCGVVAGVVILIMSVTGVLLTYQRQMQAWADMRGYWSEPADGSKRLPVDALIEKVAGARPDLKPTAIVIRSEPGAPTSLAAGPGRQVFVHAYSGDILGEGNGQGMRDFFRSVVDTSRWQARAARREGPSPAPRT